MEILVEQKMKVADLVRRFSEVYPFLRLEVYFRGEEISNAAHHSTLREVTRMRTPLGFSLLPEMKVSEVEELFWKKMGVQVAVFRKAGNTWLEASFTNYWSLARQNALGKEMSEVLTAEIKRL